MFFFYIAALSILQNGPIPRFLSEEIIGAVFFDHSDAAVSSSCVEQLQKGFSEFGIVQVMSWFFGGQYKLINKIQSYKLFTSSSVKVYTVYQFGSDPGSVQKHYF